MALLAALAWFILVGGTELGSLVTPVRAINAAIGGVIIGYWLWHLPGRADRTDRLVLGALILFLIACVTSDYQRMSYEAATTALAYAAAFSVARWEVADPRNARALVTLLGVSALGLVLLFVALWGSIWRSWITVTGLIPPLNLILPVGPYRHYHVVAMLLALLLPALIQMTQRRLANVMAYAGIVGSLVLVVMAGSRTVWLALVIAATVTVIAGSRRAVRVALVGLGIAAVGAIAAAPTGVLAALLSRVATTSTIDLRLEIWSDSLSAWLSDPILGSGPGTFGAAFTFTDYFTLYERVGRHADNAVVQVLMEAGLLGLLAIALLVGALILGMRAAAGRWTKPALMGVVTFAALSMTDNPSDTANLIAILVCWAALCTPAVPRLAVQSWHFSWCAASIGVAASVVAVATTSLLAASAIFDIAQAAAGRDDRQQTVETLGLAIALDPGHALYWRERGLHRAEGGIEGGALSDLRTAIGLNPADTTAIRALAVLEARDGEGEQAVELAESAARLRPTHEENLATLAFVASMANEQEVATEALRDLVARMPWLVASASWADHFPTGSELATLLRDASHRWEDWIETDSRLADPRFAMSQVWLNAAVAGPALTDLAKPGWRDLPYVSALDALLRCDLDGAEAILRSPPAMFSEADLIVRMMTAELLGERDHLIAATALADLGGLAIGRLTKGMPEPRSPFWGPEEDRRIYERSAVVPVELGISLPTEAEALSAWLMDPRGAARIGAPESGLATCQP